MLTSLVENMAFTLSKETFSSVHINGFVAPSLIFMLTVVSGIQQKSDICQVLKKFSSNLTASQKHRTERNN